MTVTVAERSAGGSPSSRRTTSRTAQATPRSSRHGSTGVRRHRQVVELVQHGRPARVALAEVGVDAAQAGRAPGLDERPDPHGAGQHREPQVGDVVAHQPVGDRAARLAQR